MSSRIAGFIFLLSYLSLLYASVELVHIDGIEPDAGHLSGGTRVMVRGGPFKGKERTFKRPKCKFGTGNRIVNATYVKCTVKPPPPGTTEPEPQDKTDFCLQCDNSPAGDAPEIIPFTISLTGDFTDSGNSIHYRYYPDPKITAIYPRYGRKNGGTYVQIWGENFLNFDQYLRCAFGTKETPAYFVDNGFLFCYSPESDVTNAPMPVAVTMNDQQYSNKIDYWYYDFPSIYTLDPNRGPDNGGTHVLLKGNNFNPFADYPIKNYNDTFCRFGQLGTVPVTVINSTKVVCISPPSYVLREVIVEITLNNQEWTRDKNIFYYYHPPFVYDIEPLMGPVAGGTDVHVHGSNFEDTGAIRCKFGDKTVNGKYINVNELLCVSPKTDKPGYVPFQVAVHEDDFSSGEYIQYLYYDTPIIKSIEPTCGPERGYTQIIVHGLNFIDPGFDMVYCIFNETIFMNATVFEPDRIKCSSPPVLNQFGVNEKNVQFYDVKITLNKKDASGPAKRFHYYKEVTIRSVVPPGGPIEGGTLVAIGGKGFKPECACNVTVRFGTFQVRPINYTDDLIYVRAPNVSMPDDVVVSYGINGQQYNPDPKLNHKDIQNTYTYYSKPIIIHYAPERGPSSGNTLIRFVGFGFTPYHDNDGNVIPRPVYVRMIPYSPGSPQKPKDPSQAEFVDNENINWRTPPGAADSHHILEISLNMQDYTPVIPRNMSYSYTYYLAPHVEAIYPPYGPLRSKKEVMLFVKGKHFRAIPGKGNQVTCRFGKQEEPIFVTGVLVSETEIHCKVPKYNKPEVLPVEISLDDIYFTSDGKTYGYYDPFVYKVTPKIVSKKGNTTITVTGYGFVNTTGTYLKVKYGYKNNPLSCKGGHCWVMAKYINQNTIQAQTLPYKDVVYEGSQNELKADDFAVEVSVYGDDFTDNGVPIKYFGEPIYGDPVPNQAAANGGEVIVIPTNFKTNETDPKNPENDEKIFRNYGNATCRFSSLNGTYVITKGSFEHYPLKESESYNSIICVSPEWLLKEGVEEETLILDMSVNGGADFSGAKIFKITERIEIFRIYPPCGPTYGGTKMRIIGTGMKKYNQLHLKWGVLSTKVVDRASIEYFIYHNNEAISQDPYEEAIFSQNDDGYLTFKHLTKYQSVYSFSPKLPNFGRTHGGQTYLSFGKATELKVFKAPDFVIQSYGPNHNEFYYYKQPTVKDMKPHCGPTTGGTIVIIRGAWFKYMKEYGVIPYAKFGNKITRCEFESTVRIICATPPSDEVNTKLIVGISLNGVDFSGENLRYHYYYPPEIKDIIPKSGPESGGTQIRLIGTHFTNLSSGSEFMCRFTSLDLNIPPKYIPAIYENTTSVICPSPGGWGSGSKVNIEITFNGEDYTQSNSTFFFYSIVSAHPRSGPSDGSAGMLTVEGSGFRDSSLVYCSFDEVRYKPISVSWNTIICKIPRPKGGDDFFGAVPLEVSVNGWDYHKFEGGFQYYPQINVSDFFPRTGPARGDGVVKFYGHKFRSDFALARPACKFGPYIGRAEVLSEHEMLCHIPEIEIFNQSYKGEAALNGEAFVMASSGALFTAYGIYDIEPNSGAIGYETSILVYGAGFPKEGKASCRFGIPGAYAILSGQVLANNIMQCRAPKAFEIPEVMSLPYAVPFSISFMDDKLPPWSASGRKLVTAANETEPAEEEIKFDPWTETGHSFTFYTQPKIVRISPNSCKVREIIDVYAYADASYPFLDPLAKTLYRTIDNSLRCSFGRFGSTPAVYINSTTVKCVTPVILDDPSTIREERVSLRVAENAMDYTEDSKDTLFTFYGTATVMLYWPYIIGILVGILIMIGLLLLCAYAIKKITALAEYSKRPVRPLVEKSPHVMRDDFGTIRTKAIFPSPGKSSYNPRASENQPRASEYQGKM